MEKIKVGYSQAERSWELCEILLNVCLRALEQGRGHDSSLGRCPCCDYRMLVEIAIALEVES